MSDEPRAHSGEQPQSDARREQFIEAQRLGHEPLEANVVRIVGFGIGLLLLAGAALGLMYGLVVLFRGDDVPLAQPASAVAPEREAPPLPGVAPNQAYEMRQQRTQMEDALSSYGWIDEREGIARIPIDRAIDLLAERNFTLPGSPARTSPQTQSPNESQPGESPESTRETSGEQK